MKVIKAAAPLVLAIILLFFSVIGISRDVYCAPSYAVSDVLDDLKSDSNFKESDYPLNVLDNKLQVIQIAESTDGELLIYVYQPTGKIRDLRASSINIAREMDNSSGLGFKNYPLKFLNSSGVFYKYRVEDFELKKDAIRYYNISQIMRPFDYLLDDKPGTNTVSEVPNTVGQFWTACTVNGDVTYTMQDSEVIEITKKYVGFVRYFDGAEISDLLNLNAKHTVRNFVAFSTDRQIDKLIKAQLSYSVQSYTFEQCANPLCIYHKKGEIYNEVHGDVIQQEPVELSIDGVRENAGDGKGGHKYKWNEIQSTEQFKKDNNKENYKLTTEGVTDVNGTQWVLNFHNAEMVADVTVAPWANHIYWKSENVSDVMILRLTFEKDGVVYNLGVVDNKQTGDGKSDNEPIKPDAAKAKLRIALIIIAFILIALIILGIIFPPFGKVLLGILKVIWLIISAPFRLIAKLITRRKETAPAKATPSKKKTTAKGGKPKGKKASTSRKKSGGSSKSSSAKKKRR